MTRFPHRVTVDPGSPTARGASLHCMCIVKRAGPNRNAKALPPRYGASETTSGSAVLGADPRLRHCASETAVSDLGGDFVDGRLRRLGGTGLPKSVPELSREPLEQRVVRLVVEDRHTGDRPSGPIDAEVSVAEAGLGAQSLRPERLPLLGKRVGLALWWLSTHDPHVHRCSSLRLRPVRRPRAGIIPPTAPS